MKAPTAILAPILALLGLALCAAPALADPNCEGNDSATTLTVQVSGMSSARGEMAITVYGADPKKFLAPKGKLLRGASQGDGADDPGLLQPARSGVYAVAVYHDANGNEDFDRSVIGMPTEGFGFSNDAPTKFGLPAFEAVRFPVKAGANLARIKLRYVK